MPAVQNVTLGGGRVGLLKSDVVVTSAQIQALHTTPVTVVPAPDANHWVAVIYQAQLYNFGSLAYFTTGADTISVKYAGVSNIKVVADNSTFVTTALGTIGFRAASQGAGTDTPGAVAGQAILLSSLGNYNQGPILSITINAAGTGYVVNDTGTINGGSADATYQVTSIGAGGSVTGISLTGNGTNYATGTAIATTDGGAQPGVGTGLKVNIVTVQPGDGTIRMVTYYDLIEIP